MSIVSSKDANEEDHNTLPRPMSEILSVKKRRSTSVLSSFRDAARATETGSSMGSWSNLPSTDTCAAFCEEDAAAAAAAAKPTLGARRMFMGCKEYHLTKNKG